MQLGFEALRSAGTAVISDIYDSMQLTPPVLDNSLRPLGAAITLPGQPTPSQASPSALKAATEKLSAIDDMPRGVVAVWASMDAKGVCCFGDLLASAMQARGCVAAVVDGGVRDTSFLEACGMPVIARYQTPAQGIGRWRVTGAQVPVTVRGALEEWLTVMPGDIVVGDADGVIVIPQRLLDEVNAKAIEWSRSESGARADIISGLPLLVALKKYGHL